MHIVFSFDISGFVDMSYCFYQLATKMALSRIHALRNYFASQHMFLERTFYYVQFAMLQVCWDIIYSGKFFSSLKPIKDYHFLAVTEELEHEFCSSRHVPSRRLIKLDMKEIQAYVLYTTLHNTIKLWKISTAEARKVERG